jgi:VanZ family protein
MAGLFSINTMSPDADEKIAGVYLNRYVQDSLHIPLFGVLMFLWILALEQLPNFKERAVSLSFIICMAYTALEETLQVFIPGRYGSLSDVAFNAVGCGVAVLLYKRIARSVSTSGRQDVRTSRRWDAEIQ